MSAAYFAYIDELVVGPYSQSEMCRSLACGRFSQDTQVECLNGDGWHPYRSFPELQVPVSRAKDALQGVFERLDGNEIVMRCPQCKQKYKVDRPEAAGERIYCDVCDCLVNVPEPETVPLPTLEEEGRTAASVFDISQEIPDGDLVCPHCWKSFDQDNLLYISVHPSLVGDPIVGEFEPRRFRPGVFNQKGQPLDECGVAATEMACPSCHLRFPAGMLDSPSLYFSIAGATAAGKSYFLTCQTHVLRQILPQKFGTAFYDLDPRMNESLTRYEDQLFMSLEPDKVVALPATQLSGEGVSDSVFLEGIEIQFPKPFVFDYQPSFKPDKRLNLVFYDNSGELFTPGRDEWVNQATRHLSHSNGITFLFDPATDANMRREICNVADPQVSKHPRVVDQVTLFVEMISRIRRHANMTATEQCEIPLVIAVCKYDIWRDSLPIQLDSPYLPGSESASLDLNKILNVSFALRDMMLRYAPGLVNAAESFFKRVYFVPVSSFGAMAEMDEHGYIGIPSEKIHPIWVEVPFLLIMHENQQIDASLQRQDGKAEFDFKVRLQGRQIILQHPETNDVVRLPENYAGARLSINGKLYDLPKFPVQAAKPKSVWV